MNQECPVQLINEIIKQYFANDLEKSFKKFLTNRMVVRISLSKNKPDRTPPVYVTDVHKQSLVKLRSAELESCQKILEISPGEI